MDLCTFRFLRWTWIWPSPTVGSRSSFSQSLHLPFLTWVAWLSPHPPPGRLPYSPADHWQRATSSPGLPSLSFLKNLNSSIPMLHSQEPSHHISVRPVMYPHRCVCMSLVSYLFPKPCAFVYRHLRMNKGISPVFKAVIHWAVCMHIYRNAPK